MATTTRNTPKGTPPKTEKKTDSVDPTLALFFASREAKRGIKVHNQQDQQKGGGPDDAEVLKGDHTPDMRFAGNAMRFKADSSKTVNGDPDRRFVENRPDIIQAHRDRGQGSNLVFGAEFLPDDVKQIAEESLAQAGAAS